MVSSPPARTAAIPKITGHRLGRFHNLQSAVGACGGRGRAVDQKSVMAQGTQISPGKANAAQKVLEARVGAEGIEARPEQDAWVKSFFETFFEPIHSLFRISERCVDHGNLRSIRITSA